MSNFSTLFFPVSVNITNIAELNKEYSPKYNSNYTTTNSNSGNWSSVYTTTNSNSGNWSSVYTTTNSNSANWNSSYTTTQANTAADSFELAYTGTLPAPLIPIFTVNPLREVLLSASGIQAATLRNGKWISGLGIIGFNNPAIDNLISLSSADIVGIRDNFALAGTTKLTSLNFPSLYSVGGSITFNGGSPGSGTLGVLSVINFPLLTVVGGTFGFGASVTTGLVTASFPSLASVGAFAFTGNIMSSLTSMEFPSLSSVNGSFSVGNLPKISFVEFPSLRFVAGVFTFTTASMFSLTGISFPLLTNVTGSFALNTSIQNMSNITLFNFPSLSSVGGTFGTVTFGGFLNGLTTLSLPSLASVGGAFTIQNGATNFLTNVLIGPNLKHINGDFGGNGVPFDRHNAWAANTYYPSYSSFTAPASSFSATTTTCTVSITNHGLQTNDLIIVSGITGTSAGIHLANTGSSGPVAVTRINANQFSYTISAGTSQIPTGIATIQRLEVGVTPVTKNGRKYICTGAGTSGATEPTWPTTIGNTVVDGTVTWTCSEMSYSNLLSRLAALSGDSNTILYGANRFITTGSPPLLITINSISTSAGVATITTATAHGLTTGTQVIISGCTGTALRYNGIWTATVTGSTTLTVPVPTDLNGVAGTGTMRLTNACPQYTGNTPIAATAVTSVSSDSHILFSTTQLRDSDQGGNLPVFPAGIYVRNSTINGFARYSCVENNWDMWYDTSTKRWVNSPSQFAGTTDTNIINDYHYTPIAVNISSTSSANPAVITSSASHGVTTGAVFTVVIEGCSNTAINGSWTATSTGSTTFTIPVDGSGGATTNSGTVAVLNQGFVQGRLMTSTTTSPIQGVQQTVTTGSNHGFSTGDFVHSYGAVGTHATSINDLNTNATTKSITTAITVIDSTSFRFVRYANTQPFVGTYTLTTFPHLRRPSVDDVAFTSALRLRARGIASAIAGTTGI